MHGFAQGEREVQEDAEDAQRYQTLEINQRVTGRTRMRNIRVEWAAVYPLGRKLEGQQSFPGPKSLQD